MASLLTFKRMLNTQDAFFHPMLYTNFAQHSSTGARGVAWGGAFSKDVALYLKSAWSYNANFRDFSRFRILTQSSVVNRIGYQVIFDPVTTRDGDNTISTAQTGGVVVRDYSSPWDVNEALGLGEYTLTDITSVSQLTREIWDGDRAEATWAVDGEGNFAHYNPETGWITDSGTYRDAFLYTFFNGQYTELLVFYYDGKGWGEGTDALSGKAPLTADYLIPTR
jgi:hypothetical protein